MRYAPFIAKRLRAWKLGVPLGLSRNFRLPETIRFQGRHERVHLPRETGTAVAFVELLFADSYGLDNVPRPVRHVVDIGANVGLFCLAARLAFPSAVIHAYEPNPQLEPYLRRQAEIAEATYWMEAVGLESGTVSLEVHPDSVLTRSHPDQKGSIPACAFHDVVNRIGGSVDLVKIDCEGAEWDLWEDHEAWSLVANVTGEYHLVGERTHDDARCMLSRLGFTVKNQMPSEDFGLIWATRAG